MNEAINAGFEKAGIDRAERHLFLCMGPDCCAPAEAERVWEFIKRRLRETKLPAMRTKAACFRVCAGGPWLVVYPEGVWYGGMTEDRFERILHDHLLGGFPVTEWVAKTHALACAAGRDPEHPKAIPRHS